MYEHNLLKSFFFKNLRVALSNFNPLKSKRKYYDQTIILSHYKMFGFKASAIFCADADDVSKESLADWMEKYKSVIGDDAPFSSEASSDFWNWYMAIFI
jgi:hypothetical protein